MNFAKQPKPLVQAILKIARAVSNLKPNSYLLTPSTRALLVGGFVRDSVLGIKSKDADLEVYGVEPKQLQKILESLFGRVLEAGKFFGVLKIPLGNGLDVDVALPRKEFKAGEGHKGFLIKSDPKLSYKEACGRRDFTINAIMADPLTGEIIDPFNGIKDLRKKTLRVVDEYHFAEDPLRVYRTLQLAARFDLKIETKTMHLMKKMVNHGDLKSLSKERVSDEIKKLLLKSPRPSVGFDLARKLGIIKKYYPELEVLKKTPQEPEWHPEGDVWIHTMMVVDEAAKIIREKSWTDEERLQIMIGALCHDLGKATTTAPGEKNGIPRIRSLGHEAAGEKIAKKLMDKWTMGEMAEKAAILGATQHLKPGLLHYQLSNKKIDKEQYANAIRKFIKKIAPLSWRVLLAIAEADYRGRDLPEAKEKIYTHGKLFKETIRKNELDKEPLKPLIQGRDLIERGLKPSPYFGKIINQIEKARDEGKIKTHDSALALLNEILKDQI